MNRNRIDLLLQFYNLMQNGCRLKGILLVMILVGPLCLADIPLIAEPSVSDKEYNLFLSNHPDYHRFSHFYETQKGGLTPELISQFQLFDLAKDESTKNKIFFDLIDDIGKNPLSLSRKKFLMELIEKHPLFPQKSELQKNQIQVLTKLEDAQFAESPLPLNQKIQLNQISPLDQIFLNGNKISKESLSKINLNPQLYYHLGIISESHEPFFDFNTAEKLKTFIPIPLLEGTCENPHFLSSIISLDDLDPQGLFSPPCIATPPTLETSNIDLNTLNGFDPMETSKTPQESKDLNKETFWKSKKPWIIGGALIVGGFLWTEFNKNYQLTITLPF